jgi:hypothetical protein
VAAIGCGEINGAQPLAGAAHYQPQSGAWSLLYLSPPWLFVGGDGDSAGFAVAPSLLSIDVAHATVTLTIEPHPGAAETLAQNGLTAWKAAHPSGTAPAAPTPITNMAGQTGVEFAAADASSNEFHREVYFDAPAGCFGLVFEGRVPLDTADVTSLIAGFEATQQ